MIVEGNFSMEVSRAHGTLSFHQEKSFQDHGGRGTMEA
jgi:hypothetical protein